MKKPKLFLEYEDPGLLIDPSNSGGVIVIPFEGELPEGIRPEEVLIDWMTEVANEEEEEETEEEEAEETLIQ